MTEGHTVEASSGFIPHQRPVRRFVVAIAVVAVALGVVWWSGAFAPRLGVSCAARTETASDATALRFELHNESPLPVDIVGVTGLDDGSLDVVAVRVDGASLPGPGSRLGGRETASVTIEVEGHGPGAGQGSSASSFSRALASGTELVVRTVGGVERRSWLGSLLSDGSGCTSLDSPPS